MVKLTEEGEKVAQEAERRFTKRLILLASVFGVANFGALVAIFVGAKSAAEEAVSSQLNQSVQNLQQVVSEALTELGDAREQVGAAKADVDAVREDVAFLRTSLEAIGPNADRLNAAARVIAVLDSSNQAQDMLDTLERVQVLENQTVGTLQLFASSNACPVGSIQLADFNIQTAKQSEFHSRSAAASTGDSSWDVNDANWDGRTFRVCQFQ